MNWIKKLFFKKELDRMDNWRRLYIAEYSKNAGLMGQKDVFMMQVQAKNTHIASLYEQLELNKL